MDFSTVFAQPIRLSVSLEDSARLQDLEERYAILESEHAQLLHRYRCCASVCAQLREYCAQIGVQFPSRLAPTPWE